MRVHGALLALVGVLLLCACAAWPWGDSPSGVVSGNVLSAPSCPVERVGYVCPPRPVSGATVVAYDGDTAQVSTRTDSGGFFRLTLPVGRYVIKATNAGGYASTASQDVVVSGGSVRITLIVDSGIR